jgi:hypothetical protein
MVSSTLSLLSVPSVDTVEEHLSAPLGGVRSDLGLLPEGKYTLEIEAERGRRYDDVKTARVTKTSEGLRSASRSPSDCERDQHWLHLWVDLYEYRELWVDLYESSELLPSQKGPKFPSGRYETWSCDEACQPRFRRDLASSPPDLENNPPCMQLSLLSFLRIILNTRA